MKNRISNIALAALLGGAAQALATPVYYTFQGDVTRSNVASHAVGTQVTYTFMVDQSATGYIDINGSPYYYTDHTHVYSDGSGYTVDYFLADYVGGDALTTDAQPGGNRYDYHFARNQNYFGSHHGYIYGEVVGSNQDLSGYDFIQVDLHGEDVNSLALWQTGFSGYNLTYANNDFNSNNQSVNSDLTLIGISNTAPASVPEPSSLALIGLGSLGLMGFRRRTYIPKGINSAR